MGNDIVMAHIDYENIRWGFRDYVEWVSIEMIIDAFEDLGNELGELRQMFFYGDWTRRPDDSRVIERRGFRAVNVLSKTYGGDRSDIKMSFDIYDQVKREPEIKTLLIGAGDADYKEAVLRCRENGKKIYILSWGSSIARELFSMTHGVYPLEGRLGLTRRAPKALPTPESLDELSKRCSFIRKLDSLEKALPHVVLNYLTNLLLKEKIYGETAFEVSDFLKVERSKKYLNEYTIPNAKIPGKEVVCVKLKRDDQMVVDALKAEKEETKP